MSEVNRALAITRSTQPKGSEESKQAHKQQSEEIYSFANKENLMVVKTMNFDAQSYADITKMMGEIIRYFLFENPSADYLVVSDLNRICRNDDLFELFDNYLSSHGITLKSARFSCAELEATL